MRFYDTVVPFDKIISAKVRLIGTFRSPLRTATGARSPNRPAFGEFVRKADEIAVDADERRGAVGELDGLDLDQAAAATEKLGHRSSN